MPATGRRTRTTATTAPPRPRPRRPARRRRPRSPSPRRPRRSSTRGRRPRRRRRPAPKAPVTTMEPEVIERLLPTVYQLATRPGSPLDAAVRVMSDLHAPDEELLAGIERVFDPYRAPDPFVFWLTRWLGIEWLVADAPDDVDGPAPEAVIPTFSPGVGRLREVVAAGHALAQWRGTEI